MDSSKTSVVLWKLLWLLPLSLAVSCGTPCVQKQFGQDRIVCVCNATYCDTVDPVPTLTQGQFVQYTSNIEGLRFQQTIGQFSDAPLKYGMRMVVNDNRTYQTILGFGGAFTDAAGLNIKSLSSTAQDHLLRSYFSPDGIEMNFGRVPIAGCDFSTHTYTYDDEVGDVRLQHFNLTMEDFQYKIPVIKRAIEMSRKPIKLIASAWSAPPWMKTNNDYSGFGFLKEEYYGPWADYHIKFLNEYEKEGLTFWAVSTGNEPSNGIMPVNRFNSLGWTPGSQMQWVRENLGPVLRNSYHKDTKIITVDDQRFMLPFWVERMKSDVGASQYIDGIGVHWYWDTIMPPSLLDYTHRELPDKFILATEACMGDKPWDFQKVLLGSWERGEYYMGDIIQDLHHWVTGWVDWNLALDTTGGPNWAKNFVDAAVIVNAAADEFYKQPMFYALGHFAKFVPEGSVRIAITPRSKGGLKSIAFKTLENNTVIIIYNQKNTDRQVSITVPHRGHLNLHLTKRSFQTIIYS